MSIWVTTKRKDKCFVLVLLVQGVPCLLNLSTLLSVAVSIRLQISCLSSQPYTIYSYCNIECFTLHYFNLQFSKTRFSVFHLLLHSICYSFCKNKQAIQIKRNRCHPVETEITDSVTVSQNTKWCKNDNIWQNIWNKIVTANVETQNRKSRKRNSNKTHPTT